MEVMVLSWAIVATVFLGLLTVATVVGSVLFLSGRPGSGVRRVGGSLALVCGSLLLLAILGGVSLTSIRLHEGSLRQQADVERRSDHRALQEKQHPLEPLPPDAPREIVAEMKVDAGLTRLPDEDSTSQPADALTPLTGHDDRTVSTEVTGKLPGWTEVSMTNDGDVTRLVISGQQFATIDEARRDVANVAREQLLADFAKTYGTSAAMLRQLPDETLRTLAVRREYVETVDRDFGNFFAPMHRVWWQVELSPAVRSELYPRWRAKEQEIRTAVVAGNLALATIGLAIVSWFTRRKPIVESPPQPAAANPVVLGVGAATLFAQRCRRWWK